MLGNDYALGNNGHISLSVTTLNTGYHLRQEGVAQHLEFLIKIQKKTRLPRYMQNDFKALLHKKRSKVHN